MRRLLLVFMIAAMPGVSAAETQLLCQHGVLGSKRVYEALLYLEKPQPLHPKVLRLPLVYEAQIWGRGHDKSNLPDESYVDASVARVADSAEFLVFDIEHWPLSSATGAPNEVNISRISRILSQVRARRPTLKIGIYSLVPALDYWRAINDPESRPYKQWQRQNDGAARLVDQVDALFPSIYTVVEDTRQWKRYALAQISEARRLAQGKPVLPFMWPEHHAQGRGGKHVDAAVWEEQLRAALGAADGVVIWGGYQKQWDPAAAWWLATVRVLDDLGRCGSTQTR